MQLHSLKQSGYCRFLGLQPLYYAKERQNGVRVGYGWWWLGGPIISAGSHSVLIPEEINFNPLGSGSSRLCFHFRKIILDFSWRQIVMLQDLTVYSQHHSEVMMSI